MGKRIGVLLSGGGSNFEALADSVGGGRLPGAEIAVVVSNREGAPGMERAKERRIAARVIPSKGLEREVYDQQVVAVFAVSSRWIWFVWLGICGCSRLFFVASFPNRILNIPSFVAAVVSRVGIAAAGAGIWSEIRGDARCTLWDENLDAGPIVLQATVPVRDDDTEETLSSRILAEEHRIYTEAVRIVLEGKYKIVWAAGW